MEMDRKIKILYALESAGGGVLKHVKLLSKHLNRNEYEIYLILPSKNYEPETEMVIEELKKCDIQISIIPMYKQLSIYDIYSLFQIYIYMKQNQVDILHVHSSKAGVLFRLIAWYIHIPVIIYTPHCFYFNANTGCKRYIYALIEKKLAKITHAIIVSYPEVLELEKQNIKPIRSVCMINNTIDIQDYLLYDAKFIRAKWNIPDRHIIVIGVGRLVKQKNWEQFIDIAYEILKKKNNYTFLIAGCGPLRDLLFSMIKKYGIEDHVKLMGYMSDISQLYSIGDIFLSTSHWEGLPYSYIEAIYYNIPMIISSTPGICDFFNENQCQCILPGTTEAFSQAILNISLRSKMRLNTPSTIMSFIEGHSVLYKRLLAKK